ncbi:AAA family ATPase [Enterococcus faecalis]|uniref:AAA family ATPase n=1 Tax=Enterococcus faecalis TaxID=1351 RepID=UPI001030BFD5|nr:AAA family ATPase [Enterococcus faecalis]TBH17995.1 AAA family ATPase [Enterococcus faecalis]
MSLNRIFVCGVHGVGKSTFIKNYEPFHNYAKYTCSDLIKKYSGLVFKDKQIDNIENNQEMLLKATDYFVNEELVLFDGHITLFNRSRNMEFVDSNILKSMNIKHFLFLKASPEIIYERLVERDKYTWITPELIEEAQDKEEAKAISNKLAAKYEIFLWDESREIWEYK